MFQGQERRWSDRQVANVTDWVLFGRWDKVMSYVECGFPVDFEGFGDGSTLVHAAAKQERLDILRELASRGADINTQTFAGSSPLCTAVMRGAGSSIRQLLSLGAEVECCCWTQGQYAGIITEEVRAAPSQKGGFWALLFALRVLVFGFTQRPRPHPALHFCHWRFK